MAARFTPSDLAERARVQSGTPLPPNSSELSDRKLRECMEGGFSELSRLLLWLGYDSIDEAIREWVRHRDRSWVSEVVTVSQGTERLFRQWRDVLNGSVSSALAFEALLFESNLCRLAAKAAQNRPQGMHYAKTLHVVRQRVALTLWERALDINWERPWCSAVSCAGPGLPGQHRE